MPPKRTKNTAGAETGPETEESPQDVEAKLNALVEELEVEGEFRYCFLFASLPNVDFILHFSGSKVYSPAKRCRAHGSLYKE